VCGIAGIWRFGDAAWAGAQDEREADRIALEAMLRAIAHRGPDDEHRFEDVRATAGVRRLSSDDLAGGRQPLSDESGTIWAGNNGELYNAPELRPALEAAGHRFRTHTDTEVIPHLYADHGADFAHHLQGMFATFVVDTSGQRLVLARDRSGIKPLYWTRAAGRLWFASELRALLADRRIEARVSADRASDYLVLGYVPGRQTVLEGIERLEPGHRLVADANGLAIEPYDPPVAHAFVPPADATARLDELERRLTFAIRRQLMSDVPLGILLSGGLDSSLLTALLPPETLSRTLTFSVGFSNGGWHEERPYARRVAAQLGTRHVERELELDVEHWTLRAASHMDEPLADPAAVPALAISEAASHEVKVLLSGTGADELFGGYRRHRLGEVLRALAPLPRPWASGLARWIGTRVGSRRSRADEWAFFAAKALAARGSATPMEAYLRAQAIAPTAVRALLPNGDSDPVVRLGERLRSNAAADPDLADAALRFDQRYYLPDDLLLKEDRMTMAVSVEGRVPFLDECVTEFANALPIDTKVRGEGKWILRELARRRLPADIVDRPKHGFSVPVTEWTRGPLAVLVRERLEDSGASGLWPRAAVRRLVDEHLSARRDHGGTLWSLLQWELWWASASGPGGARSR
jgi:asparagine synthase (glutamine-hydrolysing)